MVDQVRSFMQTEFKQISSTYEDFTSMKQTHLRDAMKKCGSDFEYPLDKPFDTDHDKCINQQSLFYDNFKYFALCLRNQVFLSPVLNGSKAVRNSVLGLDY